MNLQSIVAKTACESLNADLGNGNCEQDEIDLLGCELYETQLLFCDEPKDYERDFHIAGFHLYMDLLVESVDSTVGF